MPNLRYLTVAVAAGAVLLAGCGAAPAAAPPSPAPAASTSTTPDGPPGSVALSGDLRTPRSVTRADLAAMPQTTVKVRFESGKGTQEHTETGVPLATLLPQDALATTDRKHDELSFGILAVGADNYAVLVSYGEISPGFGDGGVMVAVTEDGKPLDRPRLVLPKDTKGGRYVTDLVELKAVRVSR